MVYWWYCRKTLDKYHAKPKTIVLAEYHVYIYVYILMYINV